MAIPPQPLTRQLGEDLTYHFMVEAGETGEARVIEEIVSSGTLDFRSEPDRREESANRERIQRDLVVDMEQATDLIRTDDGNYVVYASFVPRLPADAPHRVEWLSLATTESRRTAVAQAERERQRELRRLLADSLHSLEEAGLCNFLYGTRAAHAAYLECSRADVLNLSEMPFVWGVELGHTESVAAVAGDEYRAIENSQGGVPLPSGKVFDGEGDDDTIVSDNILVGWADPQGFYRVDNHPAYWFEQCDSACPFTCTSTGDDNRILDMRTCDSGSCVTDYAGAYGTGPDPHGTRILGAFGSLMNHQDPCSCDPAGSCSPGVFSDTEQDYSYAAWRSRLLLFRGGGPSDTRTAIEDGADTGVDIFGLSVVTNTDDCDSGPSTANRDAWDYAYARDVLGVISAGNKAWACNDDCRTSGYEGRTDVLVVGGFQHSDPYNSADLMGGSIDMSLDPNCTADCVADPTATCSSSAPGGADLRVSGSVRDNARAVIDLVAPNRRLHTPRVDANDVYDWFETASGTSHSAPEVAAAAVSFRDWAAENGLGFYDNPSAVHVAMLLLGDGTTGNWPDPHEDVAPVLSYDGIDRLWGTGRLRMRVPSHRTMDKPWIWGGFATSIDDGEVHDILVGSGPMGDKPDAISVAISWNEPWLDSTDTNNEAADILLELIYTAPEQGSCVDPDVSEGTIVRFDYSYDVHKLVRVRGGQSGGEFDDMRDQCVWIRITGADVTPNESQNTRRRVWGAYYREDMARNCGENLGTCDAPAGWWDNGGGCSSQPDGCVQ